MGNINNDKIDLRRYIAAVKRYKWLYIAALVVMLSGSIFFALTREPKYEVYSTMLIESDDTGGSNPLASMNQLMGFFSMGGFGSASVDNELVVVNSNNVLTALVKELQLNRKYYISEGFMQKRSLYDDTPLLLIADDNYFDTVSSGMQFKIELKKNGKADIKVVRGFFSTLYDSADVELPVTVDVDNAKFTLLPTDDYVKGEPLKMNIALSSNLATIKLLRETLLTEILDAKTTAITFGYSDPNLERGKAVLNTLMKKYNEFRLTGKTEKAARGVEFMDEQLAKVYADLVRSEASMEEFKAKNNVTDITVELEVMLQAVSELNKGMLSTRAQLMMCDLMLKFLTTEESKYSLLPTMSAGGGVSTGSEEGSTASGGSSGSITDNYNALVLKRMRLMRSARPDNRALAEVTANIDAMRGAVIESVKQQKSNVLAAMSVLEDQYGQFESRLKSTPQLERQYVDLARERELNNQIYLLLLGQRTDYQLKVASKEVPATVVADAYINEPASGLKNIIFPIIGLFVALFFPSLYVLYALWRHKEINKDYDMPLSVKNGGYATYEDMLQLRSDILSPGNSKLVPIAYETGREPELLASAVAELCGHIGETGRKVAIVDLGNVCGCCGQLDGIADKAAEPVKYLGFDYYGYTGSVASDMLLNEQFGRLMTGLYEKYGSVVMLFNYSKDALCAVGGLDKNAPAVVYMVKSGVTRRDNIDTMVKSLRDEQKILFQIY